MPLPIIADTYRVALTWSDARFPTAAINVLHFRKGGSSAAALYTSLDANVTAAMWGFQSSDSKVNRVDITPLDGTSLTVQNSTGTPAKWSGNGGVKDATPQAAAILKLTTALRGRTNRGRIYLPWVREDAVTAAVLDSTLLASTQTAWATFITALSGAGFKLVVASYVTSVANDVTATRIEQRLATQRRRNKRTST